MAVLSILSSFLGAFLEEDLLVSSLGLYWECYPYFSIILMVPYKYFTKFFSNDYFEIFQISKNYKEYNKYLSTHTLSLINKTL